MNFYSTDISGASGTAIDKLNRLVSFILKSCPYLKTFDFSAYIIRARGVINMYFRENRFLHIKLNIAIVDILRFITSLADVGEKSVMKSCSIIVNKSQKKHHQILLIWHGTLPKTSNWISLDEIYNQPLSSSFVCMYNKN